MDPITWALVGIGLAATIIGAVVYFWPQIMEWSMQHLLPWVDEHLPELAPKVREAFRDLDEATVEVRAAVKRAWQHVRTVLLQQTAKFVRHINGRWAVQITAYLRDLQRKGQPIVRRVTEQDVEWEQLPPKVRAQAIAGGIENTDIDVTGTHDRLLDMQIR